LLLAAGHWLLAAGYLLFMGVLNVHAFNTPMNEPIFFWTKTIFSNHAINKSSDQSPRRA